MKSSEPLRFSVELSLCDIYFGLKCFESVRILVFKSWIKTHMTCIILIFIGELHWNFPQVFCSCLSFKSLFQQESDLRMN